MNFFAFIFNFQETILCFNFEDKLLSSTPHSTLPPTILLHFTFLYWYILHLYTFTLFAHHIRCKLIILCTFLYFLQMYILHLQIFTFELFFNFFLWSLKPINCLSLLLDLYTFKFQFFLPSPKIVLYFSYRM